MQLPHDDDALNELHYTPIMAPRFGALEHIDISALAEAVTEQWYSETLCQVNDALIRLGVFRGEYNWHHHDEEDEFFYVVEGQLRIEVEASPTIVLGAGQAACIPRGVEHRPVAIERTVALVLEPASVQPTGDR
jgi:mannose-6-phosphate isomerase-like protein (cupin superfamily)